MNWIDILLVLVIGFSILTGFTAGLPASASASSPRYSEYFWASGATGSLPLTCWITSAPVRSPT